LKVELPGAWDRPAMKSISTNAAPKPVAAYSQAIEANGFIFCSGQIGLDPATGTLADGIEAQAENVFHNLRAVLEAAGSGFERVVKVTLYIADMAAFAAVNQIYARYVGTNHPARTTIAASGLPLGALIEADVIALK
jgi:2-iminobutanoate/2-iminopropanoate deaminase